MRNLYFFFILIVSIFLLPQSVIAQGGGASPSSIPLEGAILLPDQYLAREGDIQCGFIGKRRWRPGIISGNHFLLSSEYVKLLKARLKTAEKQEQKEIRAEIKRFVRKRRSDKAYCKRILATCDGGVFLPAKQSTVNLTEDSIIRGDNEDNDIACGFINGRWRSGTADGTSFEWISKKLFPLRKRFRQTSGVRARRLGKQIKKLEKLRRAGKKLCKPQEADPCPVIFPPEVPGASPTPTASPSPTPSPTPTLPGFSLSGDLSGLGADSMELTLVSEDVSLGTIELLSDGGFSFTQTVLQGDDYHVRITRDPSDRACLVRNAKGTIAAEVTNIEVFCDTDVLPAAFEGGSYQNVRVHNGFLYVAATVGGVDIFSLADPDNPVKVSTIRDGGPRWEVSHVVFNGNLMYIAGGVEGFFIYDISDPIRPQKLGSIFIDQSYIVQYQNNVVYLGHEGDSFSSIDVSDPMNPSIIQTISSIPVRRAQGLTLDGQYAYLCGWIDNLSVIDISNPANMQVEVAEVIPGFAGYQNKQRGNLLFQTQTIPTDGFVVIDVSNPLAPSTIGSVVGPSGITLFTDIVLSDNSQVAYTGSGSAMIVYDVSDPTSPSQLSIFENTFTQGLFVDGDRLYAANRNSGLATYDISIPAMPVLLSSSETLGLSGFVHVIEDIALIGEGGALLLFDISDPLSIEKISQIVLPSVSNLRNIVVVDDLAYIAAGNSGLFIVDISTPESPALVNTIASPDFVYSSYVSNTTLFLGTQDGVDIIDVSTPTTPVSITQIATPRAVSDLLLVGSSLYIGNGSEGLFAYDVSTLAMPVMQDLEDTPGGVTELTNLGNLLFVADGGTSNLSGLLIFDITDPTDLTLLGSATTPGAASDVRVGTTGNYAYVTDTALGTRIYDVQDPSNPLLVDSLNIGVSDVSVDLKGRLLFIASQQSGIEIYKLPYE